MWNMPKSAHVAYGERTDGRTDGRYFPFEYVSESGSHSLRGLDTCITPKSLLFPSGNQTDVKVEGGITHPDSH